RSEASTPFIKELEGGDDLSALVADGKAENVSGAVACLRIHVAVESRVGISIGDVEDFAALGHVARNAPTERQTDFPLLHSVGDERPDLFALFIHQEKRAALCVRLSLCHFQDAAQQLAEVQC